MAQDNCERTFLYPPVAVHDSCSQSFLTEPSAPPPVNDIGGENTEPKKTLLNVAQEKVTTVVRAEAQKRNLAEEVILGRLSPIDILTFGRSGVGKSCLLKAITKVDIPTSAQLDHCTETLTEVPFVCGKLTFRFWDTKGIDKWSSSDDVDNLLDEIKLKDIKPLFVIYCACAASRVDSVMLTTLLKSLQKDGIPVAYVITNMYAHTNEQLKGQLSGGLQIMSEIFYSETGPVQINKFHYEFNDLYDNQQNLVREGKGLLIAVNSAPFENDLTQTYLPVKHIYELMDFVAKNLHDKDFAKFVALTLNNRDYWDRVSDAIKSKCHSIKDTLKQWGFNLWEMLKNLYSKPKGEEKIVE
ncbi:unnamed protein product [Didymodactylos carnosus]|uniref:G domain-containing protein n=1 Tax=Didymodactylos carnosus TaxID=1234261 RepID=A0A815SYH7_9BILA|nr:unnamed protein product [Didymodactylos carnosus]CAF4356815.1 unnamed protein product [Didymodactylos carnosus]